MTGENILQSAKKHFEKHFILGAKVPKNKPSWKGPWVCVELVTWTILQITGKLYGGNNKRKNPALANVFNSKETINAVFDTAEAWEIM